MTTKKSKKAKTKKFADFCKENECTLDEAFSLFDYLTYVRFKSVLSTLKIIKDTNPT